MKEIQVPPGDSDVLKAREEGDSACDVGVNDMSARVTGTSLPVQVLLVTHCGSKSNNFSVPPSIENEALNNTYLSIVLMIQCDDV